jgi:hypothetical protein
MPFCPTCRFEYLPGETTCPDCHVPLVAELPRTEPRSEADLEPVLLGVVVGALHAGLLQGELRAQGIPSRAQDGWSYDPLLGAVGAPPPALAGGEGGYVAVFVNRVDLDRAKTVYHDFEETDGVEGEE